MGELGIRQGPPPAGPLNAAIYEINVSGAHDMDEEAIKAKIAAACGKVFGVPMAGVNVKETVRNDRSGQGRMTVRFSAPVTLAEVSPETIEAALVGEGLTGYKQVIEGYAASVAGWGFHDPALAEPDAEPDK